jgi:hypothetical protein
MKFKPEPVELQGRQLPMEQMLFKDGGKFAPGSDQADWSQAFRGNKGD